MYSITLFPSWGGTLDDTLLPNNADPFWIFNDNPLYVNVTLNDFHLLPGSLMIDKGNPFPDSLTLNDLNPAFPLEVFYDFEGIPRAQAGPTPPEVQNVEFPTFFDEFGETVENTDTVTWDPLPVIPTAAYNIYRGLLSQLSASFYGTCETQKDNFFNFGSPYDTQFIEPDLLEVGEGFFYLITGEDHTACVGDLGVFEVNGESPMGDRRFGPLPSDRIPRLDPANTCMLTCFDYFQL